MHKLENLQKLNIVLTHPREIIRRYDTSFTGYLQLYNYAFCYFTQKTAKCFILRRTANYNTFIERYYEKICDMCVRAPRQRAVQINEYYKQTEKHEFFSENF